MEYTIEDLLEYWKNNKPAFKTRKREVLDVRNYIIGILYYKFNVTETELETLMQMDRSTMNHAKKHPYNLIKAGEATFMRHTINVRKLFPYEFPIVDRNDTAFNQFNRQYSYIIHFDKKTYHKIQQYCALKDMDPRTGLRHLIQKALALWEE
jgi:hypothetical protein